MSFISPLGGEPQITSSFDSHVHSGRTHGIDLIYKFSGDPKGWAKKSFDKPLVAVTDMAIHSIQNDFNSSQFPKRKGEKWIFARSTIDPSLSFLYLHNNINYVKAGQTVKQGDVIATMGYTGHTIPDNINGTHLHFEIRKNGVRVDPAKYINFKNYKNLNITNTMLDKEKVLATINSSDLPNNTKDVLISQVKENKGGTLLRELLNRHNWLKGAESNKEKLETTIARQKESITALNSDYNEIKQTLETKTNDFKEVKKNLEETYQNKIEYLENSLLKAKEIIENQSQEVVINPEKKQDNVFLNLFKRFTSRKFLITAFGMASLFYPPTQEVLVANSDLIVALIALIAGFVGVEGWNDATFKKDFNDVINKN